METSRSSPISRSGLSTVCNASAILESKDIVFTKLVTCRHAYVVYDLDYQKNIKTIEEFAAGEGIVLLGRWGEFRYHNSDRCVENAMEKAKQFLRTPV